jgi:hypothetical protein
MCPIQFQSRLIFLDNLTFFEVVLSKIHTAIERPEEGHKIRTGFDIICEG